ncbi:helix-turn-helix domain containing protein, partial [Mycobacteroides abscessus subsp. massiliense]
MSEIAVVDEHEVEVLKTITLAEAEQMAAEIRELAAVARDGFEKLTHAVKEAKATNIHQVLGYRSWPEF